MQKLTAEHFRLTPWKNGGGTTQELYCLLDADQDILLRLSRATVSGPGPFSLLPGLQRTLLVLQGEGLLLDMSGDLVELSPFSEPFHFDGGSPIHCDLVGGPVEDFNVMIDPSFGRAEVSVSKGPLHLSHEVCTFVYVPTQDVLWVIENEGFRGDFSAEERAVIVRVDRSRLS